MTRALFPDDLQEYLLERNAAFRNLDLNWAAKQIGGDVSHEVLLIALHKARYECTAIESHYRHESAAWLRQHGYSRMVGHFLPEGELPE